MIEFLICLYMTGTPPLPKDFKRDAPALFKYACKCELATDTCRVFQYESQWAVDWDECRKTAERIKGFPPLSEAVRFRHLPDDWMRDALKLNRDLQDQVRGDPEMVAYRNGLDYLHDIYLAAFHVTNECCHPASRRHWLNLLKENLTHEQWTRGELPPCFPLDLMKEAK